MNLKASVVITTKNRKEDLRKAVRSSLAQQPPLEIIVIDDGSTDGTAEMVRTEFPGVVLHRFEVSKGSIVRRNQGARMATGEIIFLIDDDSEFSTPDIVEQTLREFAHPRVGAVAIPYVDVKYGPQVRHRAPEAEGVWVAGQFVGAAAALRRDVFLALGGYRELLQHMAEERDYCLRMLDAGFVVKMGRADLINHYESPIRKSNWNRRFGRRNDLLNAVCNIPFPQVLVHFPGTMLSGALYGARNGCLIETLKGYLLFASVARSAWAERKPVAQETYRLARLLKRQRWCRLEKIESRLPALVGVKPNPN